MNEVSDYSTVQRRYGIADFFKTIIQCQHNEVGSLSPVAMIFLNGIVKTMRNPKVFRQCVAIMFTKRGISLLL